MSDNTEFNNGIFESYKEFWLNTFNFTGRATRTEFWVPKLFNNIVYMILLYSNYQEWAAPFAFLFAIPSLAVLIRRFHDTAPQNENSAMTHLSYIIPMVLLFLGLFYDYTTNPILWVSAVGMVCNCTAWYICIIKGDRGENQYGEPRVKETNTNY